MDAGIFLLSLIWTTLGAGVFTWIVNATSGLNGNAYKILLVCVLCGPLAWAIYLAILGPRFARGLINWIMK